jgi:hypothetical protein
MMELLAFVLVGLTAVRVLALMSLRPALAATIVTLLMVSPAAAHPPRTCLPDGTCTICGFAGCMYPLLKWQEMPKPQPDLNWRHDGLWVGETEEQKQHEQEWQEQERQRREWLRRRREHNQ